MVVRVCCSIVHLHCLVLDWVYRITEDAPAFHPVPAPTAEQLQVLLTHIIKRLMKVLTRKGFLIEEQGMSSISTTAIRIARSDPCGGGLHLPHCPRAPGGAEVLTLQLSPVKRHCPQNNAASTRRASASTPRCAAPPISARSWSTCADTSPVPPLPTNA